MVAGHVSFGVQSSTMHSSVTFGSLPFAFMKNTRGPLSSFSLHNRRSLTVHAGPAGSGEQSGKSSSAAVQNPPPRTRPVTPAEDLSLQTVYVEDPDVTVEGVAKVDRNESSSEDSAWRRIALLAGGDVIVLLAFAVAGRLSHGLPIVEWDALRTADPFIAGWLFGAYLLGGYGPDGLGVNGFRIAVFSAVKSWAVGIPFALVIRGVTSGHVPSQPFIIVSMASTLVLLVGWRAAASFLFPNEKLEKSKQIGNKKGSVFELLQLLSSLVRRW